MSRAADQLPPCTASVAGADLSAWREVSGPGFRVCIPGTWTEAARRHPSGAAGSRWAAGRTRSLEWNVGPFSSERGAALPYNKEEVRELWFDGRPGRLTILSIQATHSMFVTYAATARAPELRLVGYASGADARAELLTSFQTLQGPATP